MMLPPLQPQMMLPPLQPQMMLLAGKPQRPCVGLFVRQGLEGGICSEVLEQT
jgi:hypothetical protein